MEPAAALAIGDSLAARNALIKQFPEHPESWWNLVSGTNIRDPFEFKYSYNERRNTKNRFQGTNLLFRRISQN